MPEPFVSPEMIERLARRAGSAARPVVLIDGGSGAGKSTLGTALASALGAELIRLEDLYPGWDGLQAASDQLFSEVLTSPTPRWQGWDWERSEVTHWRTVDPTLPLVIEGSGALSQRNRAAATLGIWVELDAVVRKARALARDGDRYAPHWERWAAQEREFALRERPAELADVIVHGDTGEIDVRSA